MTQLYTNVTNIPLSVALFLSTDTYDLKPKENTISVTTLMKSPRQVILGSRLKAGDGLTDLSQLVAARLGTSLHQGIEDAWLGDYKSALIAMGYPKRVSEKIVVNPTQVGEGDIPVYLETRTERTVGKWTISGSADFIINGEVQDFKNTGTFNWYGKGDAKYIQQMSMYKWLNPDKITFPMGTIIFVFKDFSALKATIDPSYPPYPIIGKQFALMGAMETETFITRKLAMLETYWNTPEPEIPHCNKEELWQEPTKYQYFAKADSKRATKNFDTQADAYTHQAQKGKGDVRIKQGKVKACNWCANKNICSQYKELLAQGLI